MGDFIHWEPLQKMMDEEPLLKAIFDDRVAALSKWEPILKAMRKANGVVVLPRARGNHEERKSRVEYSHMDYDRPVGGNAKLLKEYARRVGMAGPVIEGLLDTVGVVMDEQDERIRQAIVQTTLEPVAAVKASDMGWDESEKDTEPGTGAPGLVPMGYPRWQPVVKEPVPCYVCARATIHFLERSATDKVAMCLYCLQDFYDITPDKELVRKS